MKKNKSNIVEIKNHKGELVGLYVYEKMSRKEVKELYSQFVLNREFRLVLGKYPSNNI